MEEENYSTESSEEEDVQEEGEQGLIVSNAVDQTDIDLALVPKVGMVFDSEEEAFQFYVKYGCHMGFGITRRSNNTFDGFRYRSTFICSKGGKSRFRNGVSVTQPGRKRGTKTGCKAKMIVKDHHFQNRWEVIVLDLEHNHPLDAGLLKFRKQLKKSPFSQSDQLDDMLDAPQSSSMPPITFGGGDGAMSSSNFTDFKSKMDKTRKLKLAEGDLDELLDFLDRMQDQNPYFFYSLDMNEQGQLRNAFWADARSRGAFNYFGDVVSFRTAEFGDAYDLLLASFTGVNHHGQEILLGCGLIAGRTLGAYLWLFNAWLRCLGDKQPLAIITDYCQDLGIACKKVFPDARHRFCLGHILQELPGKLQTVEDKDGVSFAFTNLVYDSITAAEFDKDWQEFIQQFGLEGNEWFAKLYDARKQWVPVYVKEAFWGGMSVMDRNDTGSNFFDGWLTPETSVKMFVRQYEPAMQSKLDKEAYEDFRSVQMRPTLISALTFEEQAAKFYTSEIFLKFQNEVGRIFRVNTNVFERNGSVVTYIVSELVDGKKMDYKVDYDSVEDELWCLCRSYQYKGILCRHALAVLRQELVMVMASKYIIPRWRKDCKRLYGTMAEQYSPSVQDLGGFDDLYRRAHQYFAELVEFGAVNPDSKEYALSVLKEVREKVMSYDKSLRDQRIDNDVTSANFAFDPVNEDFTDDISPMTLHSKGWDLMPGHSKRARKKKVAKPTVLDTLKKNTKKAYNKRRNAAASSLSTGISIGDGGQKQTNEINDGWALAPATLPPGAELTPQTAGAAESYSAYGVENISFDLSQYNNAQTFQWPESSSRSRML